MKKNRALSSITLNVALAIGTADCFNRLEEFTKKASCCEYTSFTHYNFFYSYPLFGKKWKDNKYCEYHQVNTICHICKCMPERNYAGIGTMYLLHNGVGDNEILIKNNGIKQYIKNTPRLSPMIILCENHINQNGYTEWEKSKKIKKNNQLQLF